MPRRTLFIATGLAIAVAVGLGLWLSLASSRSRDASPEKVAKAAPPPKAKPAAPVAAPASPPEPRPDPRRRPATKPAEPAPAPTDAEPAAPTVGTLHVEADVPEASVFLDQQYVGPAPATIPDVTPGSHRLNVSAEGHDGYAATIDVQPGERTIMVRFKEVRLDAAIDVVHKHGMGSCRGRLVATPDGLRYETDNKNDRFTVPLLRLEGFEVDYLQKNLRVKLKGGKTYNFTDPDGIADRLFVFQRDVQKVRDRIAAGK